MTPLYTGTSALELIPVGWGYAAILGLTVAFGTMYLPAKKFDTGNGKHISVSLYCQWISC